MVLIIGGLYFFRTFLIDMLERFLNRLLRCCGSKAKIDDIFDDSDDEADLITENIKKPQNDFWQSLNGEDQKIWYASEVYSNFRFGIDSVSPDALEQLRTVDRRKAPKIECTHIDKFKLKSTV